MLISPVDAFQVWEDGRLNEANEKGTLVILENFDPSFAASEVEVLHLYVLIFTAC